MVCIEWPMRLRSTAACSLAAATGHARRASRPFKEEMELQTAGLAIVASCAFVHDKVYEIQIPRLPRGGPRGRATVGF